MEWPRVAPAPIVAEHAVVWCDPFDHPCQFRHVQHALTGLILLPNTSMAHMARGMLESADQPHLSRLLSEAPGREDAVHRRRIRFMLQATPLHRRRRRDSLVVLDDPLCAHVGHLCDHVDRHDHHGDGTSPLAPHPVTSFSVSGPGRFPLGLRLSRREKELTPGKAGVAQHVEEPDAVMGHVRGCGGPGGQPPGLPGSRRLTASAALPLSGAAETWREALGRLLRINVMNYQFDRTRIDKIPRHKILGELESVAEKFNFGEFGKRDFDTHSQISALTAAREFSSWRNAMEALTQGVRVISAAN